MSETLLLLAALTLDALLGEPRRFHPLRGFGFLVEWFEALANTRPERKRSYFWGIVGYCLLALMPALAVYLLFERNYLPAWGEPLLSVLLLYFGIARASLFAHASAVARGLAQSLAEGRRQVAKLVSRDSDCLDTAGVSRAAIESTLENSSDAVLAPIFWFVLGGPAMLVLYRLSNTLDAMWGYRNRRFRYFGWASARADDLLNYIPARLLALAYCVLGGAPAWRAWRAQASACASPNGGPVMCAGAGALKLSLGGPASYHGQLQQRPQMGYGPAPSPLDIERSCRLSDWALLLAGVIILLAGALL
ncbi:MAG: adenosylcobinamide-phosphate synthase CbiB [Cellvibrionaceae bacterium]|nr:adenosylcobinamide-phosphate synthase CbiB [Cellvibrionaceae bacterium]